MADAPTLLIFPVKDFAAAKTLFTTLLGVEPYVDGPPYYVGYRVGDLEIGLAQGDSSGPIAYWNTDDIHGRVDELVAAGARIREAARDVGGGLLVATVTDAEGSVIGLRQHP